MFLEVIRKVYDHSFRYDQSRISRKGSALYFSQSLTDSNLAHSNHQLGCLEMPQDPQSPGW
jgi:hypothetical protein